MNLNRSLFIVILIVIFSCTILRSKSIIEIDNVVLVNPKGDSFKLSDTITYSSDAKYFLIYNSKNCKDCFEKINTTICNTDNKILFYVITVVNNKEIYTLKPAQIYSVIKVPNADNVFFEIAKQEGLFEYTYPEEGIFKKYNIDVTPCILRYKRGKLEYFPYESIFKNGGYDDSWYSK